MKSKAIEENQAILVELSPVLIRVTNVILRAFGKTVGKVFDEREDTLAQVFFKISLCSQGTLADVVEPAFALSIAREGGGTEQGEDNFEVFTRLEREFEVQREI